MARTLYLSASSKSSGKTTVAIGLCRALRDQGLQVRAFKKGPDYIDPMWLTAATGQSCYNLDFYTADSTEIVSQFRRRSASADIALIEGNKGLYDGMDLLGGDSNAAMAKLTDSPVILVLDCQGTIRGVAPLVLGYQSFDPGITIAGVILNKVGGSRHEAKLRAVLQKYTDIPVVGAVYRDAALELTERHLGLMPSNEHASAEALIDSISRRIAGQVDLQQVQALSRNIDSQGSDHQPESTPGDIGKVRIGLMRDRAFGFYYPDDLEALEAAGAELVSIDALNDQRLPALDGLFIGGGFPETKMAELAANHELRAALKSAIEAGLPAYAECGGLMYLCRSLHWRDRSEPMVGVIEADCEMHDRPQGRGYARFTETDPLWPGPVALEISAHEFHYSRLLAAPVGARYAYRVIRGQGVDGQHDGIVQHNLMAAYIHRRNTRQDPWAQRFVSFVRTRV